MATGKRYVKSLIRRADRSDVYTIPPNFNNHSFALPFVISDSFEEILFYNLFLGPLNPFGEKTLQLVNRNPSLHTVLIDPAPVASPTLKFQVLILRTLSSTSWGANFSSPGVFSSVFILHLVLARSCSLTSEKFRTRGEELSRT